MVVAATFKVTGNSRPTELHYIPFAVCIQYFNTIAGHPLHKLIILASLIREHNHFCFTPHNRNSQ